jgi:hypothetical protein
VETSLFDEFDDGGSQKPMHWPWLGHVLAAGIGIGGNGVGIQVGGPGGHIPRGGQRMPSSG